MSIQEIYAWLAANFERNQMIVADVLEAIRGGRSPVLLTERRERLAHFTEMLAGKVKHIVVLSGGMGRKRRAQVLEQLKTIPEEEERLILATGRYLGKGFDDARLDTLFLALPISWRGTVAQYAERLHRNYARKKEVVIYDYVNDLVPVLARMVARRRKLPA
jgi:superfamily II DNA or RNA helicase